MKRIFKLSRIILVAAFVSAFTIIFFSPKPPLLKGMSFSQVVNADQGQLLRLTLSQDEKFRVFTPLKDISQSLIDATLLQEDRYFYHHIGVNPITIFSAAWQTYVRHSRRIGASTLTMQVARMRFGIPSKSIRGKLLQIAYALQLERHYSKNDLLEAYFNLAPYNGNIEGVGAASLIYFDKPAKALALSEALTLSVIPQNPNQRRLGSSALSKSRSRLFKRWLVNHPEDKSQEIAINLPVEIRSSRTLPFIAPHFVNEVLKDNPTSPIITTLDTHLQQSLVRITQQYLKRQHTIGINNAAILLVDARDHSVKAMVGSGDFFDTKIEGQINGTQTKRSPGSTLKPFIYGLAIDQGLIHPNTVLKDIPHHFGAYNPENFDYDFMGPIKAKDALTLSRNIPAIYLASQLKHPDLHQFLSLAHVQALKPASYYGLALSLGGAELTMQELTSLYMMLVNEGRWYPLRTRIDSPWPDGQQLLSREASFLVLDMLQNTQRPDTHGYNNPRSSLPVAWKTGTSSGFRDAWTIGNFGPYVLTVWLGNFNNESNSALIGKNIAAPLFFALIDAITKEQGPLPKWEHNPVGLNLTHLPVCKASGLLPTRYCHETELTWFIPGVSPIKTDTIYREVAIDKRTGLRTCHFDEQTRFDIYEFWPSDLLQLFKQAGIARRQPPSFDKSCTQINNQGLKPQITSLQKEIDYIIPMHQKSNAMIPLIATVDADIHTIYWFVNDTYLGNTPPDKALLWQAKPGQFTLRVIDEKGRADAKDIRVKMAG